MQVEDVFKSKEEKELDEFRKIRARQVPKNY